MARDSLMRFVRFGAAIALFTLSQVFLATGSAVGDEGGCLPAQNYGCITHHNAYNNKACSGTGCITCNAEPEAVWPGCGGDLQNKFNPSISGCN